MSGLSKIEVMNRLREFGPNEIDSDELKNTLTELKNILLDPMGLMLLTLSLLYFLLGDKTDSIILLVAYLPVTGVDVLLELRSSRALKSLRKSLAIKAKVIRDSTVQEVMTRDLVPDDVLVFEEGQTLPADGILLEAESLSVNESSLTGESLPVEKHGGDSFFSGTTVIGGRGLGQLTNTGRLSRYGAIASMLRESEQSISPLRKTVDKLVHRMVYVAIAFALCLFVTHWLMTRDLIGSLILALTLGMAAVPEEFPLVFTLYLSMGAFRLSRKGVLIKSLPSVEALGGVDVICVDKTGTLTLGVFQLEEIVEFKGAEVDRSPPKDIWQIALMSIEKHVVDSMDHAILQSSPFKQDILSSWELVFDNPFEKKEKFMSHVWRHQESQEMQMAMKGAVEGVLDRCQLSPGEHSKIKNQIDHYANQGKRLLGLAYRTGEFSGDRMVDERNLIFVGIMVFADPIRVTVKAAIEECQQTGIEIKMLTGDHLFTAHAVANQIGLRHDDQALYSGEQLTKMSETERQEAFIKGAVFARVLPEQKHEMVQCLRNRGHVVAMTGDGVNDAPALKLADIGISMGSSATDVARSTAKMILMKNDFAGIVHAVFEGRQIFSNLRRSFSYLIAFHIPIVFLSLLPPFLKWPALLLPVHIILLELIVHPVSAFTFENLSQGKLAKNTQRSLLSRAQVLSSAISGFVLAILAMSTFFYFQKDSVALARSFAMAVVLFGNLFFVWAETFPILNIRIIVTSLILVASTVFLTTNSWVIGILHFDSLNWLQLVEAFVLSAVAFVVRVVFQKIQDRVHQSRQNLSSVSS